MISDFLGVSEVYKEGCRRYKLYQTLHHFFNIFYFSMQGHFKKSVENEINR